MRSTQSLHRGSLTSIQPLLDVPNKDALYCNVDDVLLPCCWTYRHADGTQTKVNRPPSFVLRNMKLNDETTDPSTKSNVKVVGRMKNESLPLRYAAAIVGKLNHRVFANKLELATRESKDMSCEDSLTKVLDLVRAVPEEHIFTDAFDTSTRDKAKKREAADGSKTSAEFADSLLHSAQAKHVDLKNVTRLELSIYFQQQLGLLTGKNAFSVLEQFYRERKNEGRQCWTWASSAGSLMGPGGKSGANITRQRIKNADIGDNSVPTSIAWWEESVLQAKETILSRNQATQTQTFARHVNTMTKLGKVTFPTTNIVSIRQCFE